MKLRILMHIKYKSIHKETVLAKLKQYYGSKYFICFNIMRNRRALLRHSKMLKPKSFRLLRSLDPARDPKADPWTSPVIGNVANWKRHQRLDEIFIFFYPHYIGEISKVVFKNKTKQNKTKTKTNKQKA